MSNIAAPVTPTEASRPKPLASTHTLDNTERFYKMDKDQLAFFTASTKIDSEDALRDHIISIQHEAYQAHAYPCIANFSFTQLKLSRLPGYGGLLELGKSRSDAIYLDVGCCLGSDIRKAVSDGYPVHNVVATDLVANFWALGHKLFNTTPASFPIPFLAGDVFDPTFLEVAPPSNDTASTPQLLLPGELRALTSLNPLKGRVSAISVCHVFHLFSTESAQAHLAHALAGLLSPLSGSTIVGVHAGNVKMGPRLEPGGADHPPVAMFYHSPESWAALWDGEVFEKGTVRVEARLVRMAEDTILHAVDQEYWFMEWSVTRV